MLQSEKPASEANRPDLNLDASLSDIPRENTGKQADLQNKVNEDLDPENNIERALTGD